MLGVPVAARWGGGGGFCGSAAVASFPARMSSSRDSPFSFSPDLVDIFGSPDSLNGAVRLAHPQLFDGSVERHLQLFANEHGGRGVCVRPGAELPANSVVGLFSGRLTCGRECRGDRLLSLPSLRVNQALLQLCVDAEAHSARFPSPLQAALYQHSCAGGSVVGEWQAADPIPTFQYLVARTSHALLPGEDLHWNFDEHTLDGLYTLSQADVLLRRRSGGLARRCPCEDPVPARSTALCAWLRQWTALLLVAHPAPRPRCGPSPSMMTRTSNLALLAAGLGAPGCPSSRPAPT